MIALFVLEEGAWSTVLLVAGWVIIGMWVWVPRKLNAGDRG